MVFPTQSQAARKWQDWHQPVSLTSSSVQTLNIGEWTGEFQKGAQICGRLGVPRKDTRDAESIQGVNILSMSARNNDVPKRF